MIANPAVLSVLLFLVGKAIDLLHVDRQVVGWVCWGLAAVLLIVAVFQWLRWPGNYGRRLESIWYLRLNGRVSLRKAAEILYSEARAQDSIWAHAAERLSIDPSPDGILCYIGEMIVSDSTIYGRRPPSTHIETLGPMQLKYGSIQNGAREFHLRGNGTSVFTDLEVSTKELRRNLRELRESLKTTTSI